MEEPDALYVGFELAPDPDIPLMSDGYPHWQDLGIPGWRVMARLLPHELSDDGSTHSHITMRFGREADAKAALRALHARGITTMTQACELKDDVLYRIMGENLAW